MEGGRREAQAGRQSSESWIDHYLRSSTNGNTLYICVTCNE